MKNQNALAIMLKVPEPGKVKTRLVPPLSYDDAAALYRCFLKDIFGKVSGFRDIDIYAAYTPPGMEEKLSSTVPGNIKLFPQEGFGLGERIYNVFKYLFAKGYKKVAVIGSDSPDLPPEYIKEPFSLLDNTVDLVLGPAKDGGYYLVAMDKLLCAPFVNIPWSTGIVLRETIKRAEESALSYKLSSRWHDIDTPDDLSILKDNPGCPASSEFLKDKIKAGF